MKTTFMKTFLPLFLLVLIIIGIVLLSTQNSWMPPFVNWILSHDKNYVGNQKPITATQKL